MASWDQQIFIGIRDQILLRFEYQGSELLAKKWDQRWKNIPRYDPAVGNAFSRVPVDSLVCLRVCMGVLDSQLSDTI